MNDKALQQMVLDEIEFEPSINSAHVGVSVAKGVVTLSGYVNSYIEKIAAEHAALRVKGVRAIAQELEVRYPEDKKTSDDEIASRILNIFAWDARVPEDSVQVKVQKGWVSLTGAVPWQYQIRAAEEDVRKLSGVIGVSNMIEVKPRVEPTDVKQKILSALMRNAETEAESIRVIVDGDRVTLEGKVHDLHEQYVISRAAWSAPGVKVVENRLMIS